MKKKESCSINSAFVGGIDYGTAISTGNSITIASDLSFSIPDATYQSITGDINLETNFKFFADQGGKMLWELDSYTVK